MVKESQYDVIRQYNSGYAASVGCLSGRHATESEHWLRGWDDGYAARKVRNDKLNEYLASIGHEPQRIVRALQTPMPEAQP